jgi:transposase
MFWSLAPSLYTLYNRWSHKGTWANLLTAVFDDPDFDNLTVDGSIVRVHQHGATKKTAAGIGDG